MIKFFDQKKRCILWRSRKQSLKLVYSLQSSWYSYSNISSIKLGFWFNARIGIKVCKYLWISKNQNSGAKFEITEFNGRPRAKSREWMDLKKRKRIRKIIQRPFKHRSKVIEYKVTKKKPAHFCSFFSYMILIKLESDLRASSNHVRAGSLKEISVSYESKLEKKAFI